MAHFYGTLESNGRTSSRCGTKGSGMETTCASRLGAVRCFAYVNEGVDCVLVEKIPWHGAGVKQVLYDGPFGKVEEVEREGHIDNRPHFPDAE